MEHKWKHRKKTGTWRVPQTQEGYDTQWSVDYGVGEDAGKGRKLRRPEGNGACNAVIESDDEIRGLAKGAADDDYPDCCGREVRKEGIFRVRLDDGSVLTCYRCGLHGGRSTGSHTKIDGSSTGQCKHPGCGQSGQHDGNRRIENPIDKDLPVWRYCTVSHKDADTPRRQLFEDIRKALGWDDPDVQAKLTALNTKQQPETPAAALAQLKNILAAGTLQAVQDALDAGPSSVGGA